MISHDKIGVYYVGNDAVLDWMIASLESLRAFEPSRELIVIPFDDNISELSRLAPRYRFTFLHDDTLGLLDQLGAAVDPRDRNLPNQPMYRRFAPFWGPFDHFLYLDADIVVLGKLDRIFDAYLDSRCEFMYFDRNMDMIYNPGAFREEMIAQHSAVGFNAGAFVSSRGMFSIEELHSLAGSARSVRENFAHRNDQTFLNYCVEIKRLNKQHYCDIVPSASCSNWARLPMFESSHGAFYTGSPGQDSSKALLFVHWAGFKQGPLMPHRKLFLRFRHRSKPWVVRFAYCGLDIILLFWVLLQALARRIHRQSHGV